MIATVDLNLDGWPGVAALLIGAVLIGVFLWLIVKRGLNAKLGPVSLNAVQEVLKHSEDIARQVNYVGKGEPTLRELVVKLNEGQELQASRLTVMSDAVEGLAERLSILERLDANTQIMFDEFQKQLDNTAAAAATARVMAAEAVGAAVLDIKKAVVGEKPAAAAAGERKAASSRPRPRPRPTL